MNVHGIDIKTLQLALGIVNPWIVEGIEFNAENKRFDIYLNFNKGTKFTCPSCGEEHCDIHDTRDKEWRHLDIFQYPTYLHVRVPRIECPQCNCPELRSFVHYATKTRRPANRSVIPNATTCFLRSVVTFT